MRLEYNEEQEKQLKITDIESILTNNLYNTVIEKFSLETELQFLQGNEDGWGSPLAWIELETGESLEITYEAEAEQYSMLIHDSDGNPMLPYYNADTVEDLLMEVIEC